MKVILSNIHLQFGKKPYNIGMKPIKLVSDTIDREDICGLVNWLNQPEIPQLTKGPITKEYESKFSDWLGTSIQFLLTQDHLLFY